MSNTLHNLKTKVRFAYAAMAASDSWANELRNKLLLDHETCRDTSVCLKANQLVQRGATTVDFDDEKNAVESRIETIITKLIPTERNMQQPAERLLSDFLSCCTLFYHKNPSTNAIASVLANWEETVKHFPIIDKDYQYRIKNTKFDN